VGTQILRCIREKNGWAITKSNESVIYNPRRLTRIEGGNELWNKNICGGFTDQEWGYTAFNPQGELLPATCPEGYSCLDVLGDYEDNNWDTLVNVDCRLVSPCDEERPVFNKIYNECCPIGVDPAYVGTTDPASHADANCVAL